MPHYSKLKDTFQQKKVLELWEVYFQIQNLPYTNGKTLGKSLNLAQPRALKAHILGGVSGNSIALRTVPKPKDGVLWSVILVSERLKQKDQELRITRHQQQVQGQPESKETFLRNHTSNLVGTQETGQPGLHSETVLKTKTTEQTKNKLPNLSLTHSLTEASKPLQDLQELEESTWDTGDPNLNSLGKQEWCQVCWRLS